MLVFVGASDSSSAMGWGHVLSQQMLLLFLLCPNDKPRNKNKTKTKTCCSQELSLQPHTHQDVISLTLPTALQMGRGVPLSITPSSATDHEAATRQQDTSWMAHFFLTRSLM